MKTDKQILRHYISQTANPYGDGAAKRSAQISEILQKYNIDNKRIDILFKHKIHYSHFLKAFLFCKKNKMKMRFNKIKLKRLTSEINYAQNFLAANKTQNQLFLWETTRDWYYYLPYIFKNANIPVIALPHNLESLVPSQKSFFSEKESPLWFSEEIQHLKQADAVFTISREEQLFLQLFGIESFYLPYYPTFEVTENLLQIRENRKTSSKDFFLLLGSAYNPPTFLGMKTLIEQFQNQNINQKLIVAGYGSEILQSTINQKYIELKGEVNNELLTDLMNHAKAVFINQPATTGALTKIPELLIAGIPIIANSFSLRSFHNIEGIYSFENISEINNLTKIDFAIPKIPKRETIFEEYFVEKIRHL